jgi:PEP-CTERM motif
MKKPAFIASCALLAAMCCNHALASPASVVLSVPGSLDASTTGYTIAPRWVDAGESFTDLVEFNLSQRSDIFGALASAAVYHRSVLLENVVIDRIQLVGQDVRIDADAPPQYEFNNIASGDYTLRIFGHAAGTSGGSYYGRLLATPAVPEPEALALLLAGLGVVGTVMRRRRS